MNSLLNMRIHIDEPLIQLRVLIDHDLRVKRRRDKDGVDAAGNGRGEDLADLQADEVGVGDDDGGELAVAVVAGLGEEQVQVGEQGAGVGDEGGAHGQHGADEAFVDQGVDAAVFDQAVK